MKIKLWKCGNCGHLEPVTRGDIPELNPVVSSTGAIKVTCPNCGAYTISKPFDNTFKGGSFLVVKPHIKRQRKDYRK